MSDDDDDDEREWRILSGRRRTCPRMIGKVGDFCDERGSR